MHDPKLFDVLDRAWNEIETLFAGGGGPSFWQQVGYKTYIFRAFREAYAIESLHGDAVFEILSARHIHKETPRREEKQGILRDICDAWSEWKYAWDNR